MNEFMVTALCLCHNLGLTRFIAGFLKFSVPNLAVWIAIPYYIDCSKQSSTRIVAHSRKLLGLLLHLFKKTMLVCMVDFCVFWSFSRFGECEGAQSAEQIECMQRVDLLAHLWLLNSRGLSSDCKPSHIYSELICIVAGDL